MSRYTSIETSRKLHEAFPEWEDLDDWYGEYVSYGDLQSVAPKYNTDYLLEKLLPHTSIRLFKLADGRTKLMYDAERPDYDDYIADTPSEALGRLALELKKEGIL